MSLQVDGLCLMPPLSECYLLVCFARKKERGSLRLKVQCHEERILDSQLYIPFVELMIKAVEKPSVSLSLSLSLSDVI